MKNLIHGILVNEEEFENAYINEYSINRVWDYLTSGDYVVHCLYDEDDKIMIYHDDNTHYHIESEIEAFQAGLQYAGLDVKITKVIIRIADRFSYDTEAVKEAIDYLQFAVVDHTIREGR